MTSKRCLDKIFCYIFSLSFFMPKTGYRFYSKFFYLKNIQEKIFSPKDKPEFAKICSNLVLFELFLFLYY